MSTLLVTGGAGFIGSNLADRLACEGHQVILFDSLARAGVARNLEWLQARHGGRIEPLVADIRDRAAVRHAVGRADAIFHLAAQVAVTTSLVEPLADFEVNLQATVGMLEEARHRRVPFIFASTNKVYGDLSDVTLHLEDGAWSPVDPALAARGIGENRPLSFHTPYGCSKGAADQYVLDYARSFGLPACVLRMSCIYGPRQMGTEDQGWVAHFILQALSGEPISIYGDGRQVRDVLAVENAVSAYVAAWTNIDAVAGRAFNLGGGPANAVSLRQVVRAIELQLGRSVMLEFADWRARDQRYFVADATTARRALQLAPPTPWQDGIGALVRWLEADRAELLEGAAA